MFRAVSCEFVDRLASASSANCFSEHRLTFSRLLRLRPWNFERQFDYNAVANQIVGLAGEDNSKVFTIDRKLGVDGHALRSQVNSRRKRDRFLHSMQVKVTGDLVSSAGFGSRFDFRGYEGRFREFGYVKEVGCLQMCRQCILVRYH